MVKFLNLYRYIWQLKLWRDGSDFLQLRIFTQFSQNRVSIYEYRYNKRQISNPLCPSKDHNLGSNDGSNDLKEGCTCTFKKKDNARPRV